MRIKKLRTGMIVGITGPDGCGKKIQTGFLVKRLKDAGYQVETISFPQYEKNFFGKMVARYLAGEFGDPTKVDPYFASMLYAGDRFESMNQIDKWIREGKIIVCDRYAGDNFLHQGSKIKDKAKREEFYWWLSELEYSVYDSLEANQTFYLDVPLEISLKLLENKEAKERKGYTGGKKDGHENEAHLREVREISEELIQRFGWKKINCAPEGKLLPEGEISDMIWEKVRPILNILSNI